MTQTTKVPANYDELATEYGPYIQRVLRRMGVTDTEGGSQEIMMKFFEKGFLELYDNSFVKQTANGPKRTSFKSFISGFTFKYGLQIRDRQNTINRKEPQRLEEPIGDNLTLMDVLAGNATEQEPCLEMEYNAIIQRTMSHLKSLPIRGTRDLPRLMEMIVWQAANLGTIDRKAISREFGVSPTAVHHMITDLRLEIIRCGSYSALTQVG